MIAFLAHVGHHAPTYHIHADPLAAAIAFTIVLVAAVYVWKGKGVP